MARDYNINFYFADKNDILEKCTHNEVENLIYNTFNSPDELGIKMHRVRAIRSHRYDWDENAPENFEELPVEVWEERFLED